MMYPYFVQHIGSRMNEGRKESGAEIVQASTGNPVGTYWTTGSADVASLLAETECAKMNAPTAALDFTDRLALYIDRVRREGGAADLIEDTDTILRWHIKRLRGLSREPLDQTMLFNQAPEFG